MNELEKLTEKYYDSRTASEVVEDIRKGDSIIESHPSPQPAKKVVDDVKFQISTELNRRRKRRINTISLKTAVAALFIIAAFLGMRDLAHKKSPRLIKNPQEVSWFWGSQAMAAEDPALLLMAGELEDIETTIENHDIGLGGYDTDKTLDEIQLEISEFETGFWR